MDIANEARARKCGRLTPGAAGRFPGDHARAGRPDSRRRAIEFAPGRNRFQLGAWVLALSGLGLAGCSSAGYHQGNAAALSMQSAAAEVQAESRAIDVTVGTLKDLVNDPGADLQRPYQHFSATLVHLAGAARRTASTGKRMAERDAVYLQTWDRQLSAIAYQHVRDQGQTRRTEVSRR